jgi:hypothetical protein
MTRINLVPVETLSRLHLIAEYRELPRVFALAHKASQSSKPWTDKQPKAYTLGTGHVLFFYDKLGFLAERHRQLVNEMIGRGYKPSYTESLVAEWCHIPQAYWNNYVPTGEALEVNRARILERTK